MNNLQTLQLEKQEQLREFTANCILVKGLRKKIDSAYYLCLSEKMGLNYPTHPAKKEELLLELIRKISFTTVKECQAAIEAY